MAEFDAKFASDQLKLIEKLADELRDLFYTKERNIVNIRECNKKLSSTIGGYFEYLYKTRVDIRESYISKWINDDRNIWMLDDVDEYLKQSNI